MHDRLSALYASSGWQHFFTKSCVLLTILSASLVRCDDNKNIIKVEIKRSALNLAHIGKLLFSYIRQNYLTFKVMHSRIYQDITSADRENRNIMKTWQFVYKTLFVLVAKMWVMQPMHAYTEFICTNTPPNPTVEVLRNNPLTPKKKFIGCAQYFSFFP